MLSLVTILAAGCGSAGKDGAYTQGRCHGDVPTHECCDFCRLDASIASYCRTSACKVYVCCCTTTGTRGAGRGTVMTSNPEVKKR
uniref:Putative secreted protein n=1 Tax=Ixodes scapularis TaxID=6945 RepID=A0A4D5RCA8_IXOSC